MKFMASFYLLCRAKPAFFYYNLTMKILFVGLA